MDSKSRLIRSLPKPLLLKDYLLDDMSSCSSNGFKSFPRRQCCTTVRFIHEFDRKNKHHNPKPPPHFDFTTTPPKSALSAFKTVIAAVKRLPFKLPEKKNSNSNSSFLPRSISRKILKKSGFWKRKPERKEIVRWKSFDQLLKEDAEPSDRSCSSIATTDSKSKSWSGSDFTVSSGNSSSELLNDGGSDGVKMPAEVVSVNGVGVTNGDVTPDSTTCSDGSADTTSKKQWSSEEKEQFSPVSVLDCPFDDEDEVSSPFQHRLARVEGTKKKLLKKIQMFECLANLEPVNLNTRFASQPDSDNESSNSPLQFSSASTDEKSVSDSEEYEEGKEEETVKELLHQMNITTTFYNKLLLDFFGERMTTYSKEKCGESSFREGLIEEAVDWINGRKASNLSIDWAVEKNREIYVREMEKGREWRTLDQETQEVATELESVVFDALLNELLLDI